MTGHPRKFLLFGLIPLLAAGTLACSGGGAAKPAATPDEAVLRVAHGLADNHPQVAWQALPDSYQKDVTELVHEAAATMDPELWNRTFSVLGKLSTLLSDKRELIFEHPMIAQGMAGKENSEESWDAAVEVFDLLVKSDLANLEKVKKLDIEKFLAGTGAELMEHMAEASALAPDDKWAEQMKDLRSTKVSVLSSSGQTATLRVERPGEPADEDDYVRVEGKWIPKSLADSWPSKMASAKQKVAELSGQQSPEDKQKALMVLSMVDGALDSMIAADSPEQFNAAVGAAMGLAMGGMMAQAGSGEIPPTSDDPSMRLPDPAPGLTPPPVATRDGLAAPPVVATVDGTIPVNQADRFVGREMWVTSTTGLDSKCRLTDVQGDFLVFERSFETGSITFELTPHEIESLRVIDQ